MSSAKKYAVVGMGARVVMYTDAIADPSQFKSHAALVAFCDISQTRMNWHNRRLHEQFAHPPIPTYLAADFDKMIRETKPDAVIITTPDGYHHEYAIRAMDLGCDVIVEKPLTIDAEKLNVLLAAQKRTGKNIRVTHNMRYGVAASMLREIVTSGKIGTPLLVDLQWMLDTAHGADYFRRWHRDKHISGGLLIHKASHHFDAVNWWINSHPQTVYCLGELKFYGKKNAEARGEHYSYSRYTGIPEAQNDPFAFFLDDAETKGLYLDAEKEPGGGGYIRDRNVMGDPITIEDTLSISAKYKNGVLFNYSLVAYSPWEGMRVAITGTKGRVELFQKHGTQFITGKTEQECAAEKKEERSLRLIPMFGEPQEIPIAARHGTHGGSDNEILARIFLPNPPPDSLHRDATHLDGAAACLLGIAANQSLRTGLPVNCDDLVMLPSI